MHEQIKVLVVDDSALVRKYLSEMINSDQSLTVVGSAPDPYVARDMVKKLNPDVITLDLEMPKMNGLTFLKNLMRLRPMPVIVVSYLGAKNSDAAQESLALGAFDVIEKPDQLEGAGVNVFRSTLITKIKRSVVKKVDVKKEPSKPANNGIKVEKKFTTDAVLKKTTTYNGLKGKDKIIAIGSSTGGTEAIKVILKELPKSTHAIVITQHIPRAFSTAFANRLDGLTEMDVCEAQHGMPIVTGNVYVAPGERHLLVVRKGNGYICELNDGPAVNRHKPSVDVLFRSVAQSAGSNALGIILTGMGNDGAEGLKELQEVKAHTIAQDKDSSVVWGMPGSAVKLGAANDVLPLTEMAQSIIKKT